MSAILIKVKFKKIFPGLVFLSLVLSGFICRAQYEVSSGIDLSYPLLINKYNKNLNYNQISFGMRFGIAYKPPETQFFPILNLSFGRCRLPLLQLNKDVVALNFNYINVMLNENFILRFTNSEVFIYGGIGFTNLKRKSLAVTGPGSAELTTTIDSVKNVTNMLPAINIGVEYNYGESAGKDLYLTMGLNFQYIMLLTERNDYYLTVRQSAINLVPYTASLTGNLITPSFYIAIHYLLHHNKKSKMYL